MADKSTFGFGAENYVSDRDISTPLPLSSTDKDTKPDTSASEDVKGRGELSSLNRGSVVTAGLEGDIAHMGTDFMEAALDAAVLDAAYAEGRSTVSSSHLKDYEGVIRDAVTGPGQAVADEIEAMIPAELRPLAEARIEAEMRRNGRDPDETAAQRDQRVQEEQSQIQDAVLGGTGLLGALDNMTGQAKQPEVTQSKDNNPFAALLAGAGPFNLGDRDAMVDFGGGTAGLVAAQERSIGYSATVADARDKSLETSRAV